MRKDWFLLFIWWDVFLCSVDMLGPLLQLVGGCNHSTIHVKFCRFKMAPGFAWLSVASSFKLVYSSCCKGKNVSWLNNIGGHTSKDPHVMELGPMWFGFFTVVDGFPTNSMKQQHLQYDLGMTSWVPCQGPSKFTGWGKSTIYLLSRKSGDLTLETLQDDVSAFTATLMACERARQRVQSALVLEDMRRASVLGDDWQFCDLPYFDSSPCTPWNYCSIWIAP